MEKPIKQQAIEEIRSSDNQIIPKEICTQCGKPADVNYFCKAHDPYVENDTDEDIIPEDKKNRPARLKHAKDVFPRRHE